MSQAKNIEVKDFPRVLNIRYLLPVGFDQSPDATFAPTFLTRDVAKLCKICQDHMMGT